MPRYIKERSFIASLRSMPPYDAQLDFSRLVKETQVVTADSSHFENAPGLRAEEYDYLTATTLPREELQFWFLCRQWDDGTESYELKARHDMFFENTSWLGNLVTNSLRVTIDPFNVRDIPLYVRPDKSLKSNPGWKVLYNGSPITRQNLATAEVGPVQIIAPTGNPLGVYDRKHFGNHWWALISCAKRDQAWLAANTVPVDIMMTVKKVDIDDPLA